MKSDEIEKIPLQQVDTELVRYALQDASWLLIRGIRIPLMVGA